MAENPLPSLPTTNYEKSVLGFLNEAITEGEAFLKEESGFEEIPSYLAYIVDGYYAPRKIDGIAQYSINRAAKAIAENAAALTDVHPLFEFRTENPMYQGQAQVINKLVKAWWLRNDIDVRLGDVITWAQVAGSGYGLCQMEGDETSLDTIDPRDVLPIRPTGRNTIEDCLGVIIRSVVTVNYARRLYPTFANRINATTDGSFWRSRLRRDAKATRTAVERLQSQQSTQDMNIPMVEIFTMQLKDDSINPTGSVIRMGPHDQVSGEPLVNWAYSVEPGKKLYPRGRWIVATRDVLLSDGPCPYWHGLFTTPKLTLDPYPWSWFGKSQAKDLIGLNELLNEIVSKVMQAARKNLQPGIIADKNALPKGVLQNLDTMKSNMKLMVNPVLGDALKFTDPVIVPNFIMELINFAIGQIDDLSGTRGLQELMTLKQLPSADTVEKLSMSLTPLIKRRGRQLEVFLRHVAEITLSNFFQFYTAPKRLQILGPDGMTIEDFDYEPGTLVPMAPGDGRSAADRAAEHIKNFPFYVVPNSLLDVAQVERKLMYLTLRRMGEIDHQTFLESLGVQNIEQIDARLGSEIDQKIALMASMAPAEGRPPTASAMPKLEQKGDGRPVVAES